MKICINADGTRTIDFHSWRDHVILTIPEHPDGLKPVYKISKLEWARLMHAGNALLLEDAPNEDGT